LIDAGSELRRGLTWFGSATLLMRLLDLASSVVVLKILSREQMGLAALSWSVVVICEAFSGLGVGNALVQAKEVSRQELDSLFWFSSGTGLGLTALMAACAAPIAWFYAEPALAPMVAVSALKLAFVSTAIVPLQMLSRNLQFRGAGIAQTAASALENITKVILALSGAGAWTLVIANSARGLFVLVVVYALAPHWPARHFRLSEVKPFLRFGLRTMTSTVIYQAYRNADFFLVGRYLGMEVLGIYRVAFSLAMTPLEVVTQVANRVGFPVYARVAHDTEARTEAFARSIRYVLLLAGPVVVVLFFGAADAVALVNERWFPAVPAIQLLAWAALLRSIDLLFPTFFQAIGRPEYSVYDAILSASILVSGFWIALHFWGNQNGMMAVCAVWLLAYPIVLAADTLWAKRIAGIGFRTLARVALPVVPGIGVMVLVLYLVPWPALRMHDIGPAGMLCAKILVGLCAYTAYLRFVLGLRLKDLNAKSMQSKPPTEGPRTRS
jgi:O-antigen/teichoic acid export membrane protein